MLVHWKRIGCYSYIYPVESVRESGKTKQRIIENLGRNEALATRGYLDRLARSAARLTQCSIILSLIEGGVMPELSCWCIGPGLIFERLWAETGCWGIIQALAAERGFALSIGRAVFLSVLHRLIVLALIAQWWLGWAPCKELGAEAVGTQVVCPICYQINTKQPDSSGCRPIISL